MSGLILRRNVPFPLGLHLPPPTNKLTNLNTLISGNAEGDPEAVGKTGVGGMECGVYNMGREEVSSNKYLPNTLIQSELNFMHKHVLL